MKNINEYLVTIDIDWASDSIIREVANYLIENEQKATWFVTHDSPEIRKLLNYPHLFELGVHPNFGEGSTQGNTPRDIMHYLKRIVPGAKSARTHCLVQSAALLRMMREEFNVLYDVSIFLPDTPNIVPHEWFSSVKRSLLRIPYFWEDDFEMLKPNPCFSLSDNRYHVNGIKVFDFHPIHIVLNSYTMGSYYRCKSEVEAPKCSLSKLQSYTNISGEGTGSFFRELVQFIKNQPYLSGLTISDLAAKWRHCR